MQGSLQVGQVITSIGVGLVGGTAAGFMIWVMYKIVARWWRSNK